MYILHTLIILIALLLLLLILILNITFNRLTGFHCWSQFRLGKFAQKRTSGNKLHKNSNLKTATHVVALYTGQSTQATTKKHSVILAPCFVVIILCNFLHFLQSNVCFLYNCSVWMSFLSHTHKHTHPFNGPFSGTTRLSWYQKSKTNLDFTEARDSEWQWHQLDHMQVCTSLQTDNPTTRAFYRPDALPAAQPTVSKHWRDSFCGYPWLSQLV